MTRIPHRCLGSALFTRLSSADSPARSTVHSYGVVVNSADSAVWIVQRPCPTGSSTASLSGHHGRWSHARSQADFSQGPTSSNRCQACEACVHHQCVDHTLTVLRWQAITDRGIEIAGKAEGGHVTPTLLVVKRSQNKPQNNPKITPK